MIQYLNQPDTFRGEMTFSKRSLINGTLKLILQFT